MKGDEYVPGTPIVRAFVASVRAAIGAAPSPEAACEAIRSDFARPPSGPGLASNVGLYRGTQDEEIYAERDGHLALQERRPLAPGDF